MDLIAWATYVFITAGVIAAAALHYRRREPPGRGRYILAGLRGAALALLILLVFAPVVPAGVGGRSPVTVALVDGSLSMRLADAAGVSRWDEARRQVEEVGADRVLLFGAGEAVSIERLDTTTPSRPRSQLAPALRSALEAGAGRVVVVTDGGIEDAREAARLAAGAEAVVDVRWVGREPLGNVGLAELEAPVWARAGEEVTVRVGIARVGQPVPDTVAVSLLREGREVARGRLATPPAGRTSSVDLRFTPAGGAPEPVRLDAVLAVDDAEPDDDVRSVYMRVTDEPGGVALVTFRPDQEPRFLVPVLDRALGLPTRGWLALGEDRFVRLGVGTEAGRVDGAAAVRRAVDEADLLVIHGLGPDAPAWARAAADRAERVVLFAATGASGVPFVAGPAGPGEWYPTQPLPASPVAPLLAGVELGRAPPLSGLRPASVPPGGWAPLHARLDRRGDARPVLVAGIVDGRRVAVAMGDGYWRWAFDEDAAGRQLYDGLWAGVGGWLLGGESPVAAEPVRPRRRSAGRGEPLQWETAPGVDSLRIALRAAEAGAAVDTVMAVADGVATMAPPPPGHYRYQARGYRADGTVAEAEGPLTVERYSPEFTRPPVALELAPAGSTPGAGLGARSGRGYGRPLHTTPWPYLALVALLCGEWVLRRRWGLR